MLVNEYLANKKVATVYGEITFDGKGQTKELTQAQQKELAKLPGFKYVQERKNTNPKKTTTTRKTTKQTTTRKTQTKASNSKEKEEK